MNDGNVKSESSEKPLVLVVEDDHTFRRLLRSTLERRGYRVREAEHGLAAQTVFERFREQIEVIVSDIRMPELDGIGFLEFVRSQASTPVVLMTGFSEIIETKRAFELGANEFLTKPFRAETFLDAVHHALHPNDPRRKKDDERDPTPLHSRYCPVPIDEFMMSSHLLSDVFIKLSETRYIKVAHKNEAIPRDRLQVYKEKNADALFVPVLDLCHYVNFQMPIVPVTLKQGGVDAEKKAKLIRETIGIMQTNCFTMGLSSKISQPAQKMVEDTLNLATTDAAILDVLHHLYETSAQIYAHGVAVAFFSCIVAQEHGWNSSAMLFKLTLSGLLLDIGLKDLSPDLLKRSKLERSEEETQLFRTHPLRGHDLAQRFKAIPEDIATLVLQHHENIAGTGYPHQTKAQDLHPFASLISVVDLFVEHLVPTEDCSLPHVTPPEALANLNTLPSGTVDLTFMRRLAELVVTIEAESPPVAMSA